MNNLRWPAHSAFLVTALIAWISPGLGYVIACGGFAIYGLQHGALDFAKLKMAHRSIPLYLICYFAVMLFFSFIFLREVNFAIAIFLVLSSYHFGFDALEKQSSPNANQKEILAPLLFGFLILVIPALSHASDASRIVSLINQQHFTDLDFDLQNPGIQALSQAAACVAALFAVLVAALHSKRLVFTIEVTALTLALIVLPLEIGFTLFFVYWHSTDSLTKQRRALNLSIPALAKESLLLTASASALLAAVYAIDLATNRSSINPHLVFMVVGALSVAHILLTPSITLEIDSLRLSNEPLPPSGSSS